MRDLEVIKKLGYETPADYFRAVGYEDYGYMSPELSSSDEYPKYIEEEVKRCAREIQLHQTHNTATFCFMTDLHYATSYNHKIRMKRTLNAYREIAKRVHIDKLVLGGDYTNEGCKEYKSECFRELRSLFNGLPYFPVNGNHDDGTIWDGGCIDAEKSTNHLTHTELYTIFYNHIKSLGAEFDNSESPLYYLVNDDITKTRYIFLDICDIPYVFNESGKLLYCGQDTFALSQNQIDWLTGEALKFNEEGWQAVIITHSVKLPNEEVKPITKNSTVLNDIISAYKNNKKLYKTANSGDFMVNVKADFTSGIKADIVGFFVGDYHYDDIQTDSDGIKYILTANAVMYHPAMWLRGDNPKAPKRFDGDKTEILFDVITVDRDKRKIFITRVGAGEDREVSY